jgi:hypothetical protein
MSTLREAAQQALEALCRCTPEQRTASDALRAALAQQDEPKGGGNLPPPLQAESVQEPVAWQWLNTGHFRKKLPVTAEPGVWTPLYTAPPRREWKSLTEEEIGDVFQAARNAKLGSANDNSRHRLSVVEIARAIEVALKEKNA